MVMQDLFPIQSVFVEFALSILMLKLNFPLPCCSKLYFISFIYFSFFLQSQSIPNVHQTSSLITAMGESCTALSLILFRFWQMRNTMQHSIPMPRATGMIRAINTGSNPMVDFPFIWNSTFSLSIVFKLCPVVNGRDFIKFVIYWSPHV